MDRVERAGLTWLQTEVDGARVAFSTRGGGVSEGPFESLNLALHVGDDDAAVHENRRRIADALGLESIRVAQQVHGVELVRNAAGGATFATPQDGLPQADGHVLTLGGEAAAVLVADCLPVAVAGPRGAAILHCGWRGLAAGIVAAGCEAVGATAAAVGPGIGFDDYEVGEEVLSAFEHLGEEATDGSRLDLEAAAVQLLRDAGVRDIETSGLGTAERPDLLFSHRRDGGTTGRQAGIVWIPA